MLWSSPAAVVDTLPIFKLLHCAVDDACICTPGIVHIKGVGIAHFLGGVHLLLHLLSNLSVETLSSSKVVKRSTKIRYRTYCRGWLCCGGCCCRHIRTFHKTSYWDSECQLVGAVRRFQHVQLSWAVALHPQCKLRMHVTHVVCAAIEITFIVELVT